MKRKSSGMAYLWWILGGFGILGFHRFYLGHIGMGIVYVFTAGLFFIGAFIDLFRIPSMVQAKNNEVATQEALQLATMATASAAAATARANQIEAETRLKKTKGD